MNIFVRVSHNTGKKICIYWNSYQVFPSQPDIFLLVSKTNTFIHEEKKLEKKDYCTSISLLVIFPTMLFR